MLHHYWVTAALTALCITAPSLTTVAATIEFNLEGRAGSGLLPGNSLSDVSGLETGTGGEVGEGISFDDVTNVLTLNFGWGSQAGFTDITPRSIALFEGLIRGPASQTETGPVIFQVFAADPEFNTPLVSTTYTGDLDDPRGGILTGTVQYSDAQAADLLEGKHYLDFLTLNFPSEDKFRANLVPVPAPLDIFGLGVAGLGMIGVIARQRQSP